MRKRFLLLLLTIISVVCVAFGISACGGGSSNGGSSSSGNNKSQTDSGSNSGNSNDDSSDDSGTHTHSLVAVDAKAATCTAEGNTAYWYCSECGKYFSDAYGYNEIQQLSTVIPATGHEYDFDWRDYNYYWVDGEYEWDADFTTGIIAVYCKKDSSHIAYGEITLSTELIETATCTEDGKASYTVTLTLIDADDESYYETGEITIDKIGHDITYYTENAATCTEDGNTEYWYCSECGKYFSDGEGITEIELSSTVIAATKHTTIHIEAVSATCTEDGNTEYWYCSECGKYFSDEECTTEISLSETIVAATKHTTTHIEAVSATCTEVGNTEYWYCSKCGKYFSDEECATEIELSSTVIPAKGHSWNNSEITTEPTCTETGVIKYTCTDCGDTYTDAISETGHTVGENGYCTSCGEDLNSAGLSYTLSEDELYYTVSGIGTCTDTYIVIPSSYNNLPVTAIDERAFYGQENIIGVYIPDSITAIGDSAFYNCYKLVEVYNDSALEINTGSAGNGYVGYYAKNIYNSTDGESNILTQFGYKFVYDSDNNYYLVGYTGTDTELELPTLKVNGTTVSYSVYQYAFYRNTSITSVTIPDGVTAIGSYAFYGCSSLNYVNITDSAAWCEITFSNITANPLYYAGELYLYDSAEQEYNLVTELEIPEGVTSISDYAFYNCASLENVIINNDITAIGDAAFSSCDSLSTVTIAGSVGSIGSSAFADCASLESVYIKDLTAWCEISFENATANPLYYAGELYLYSSAEQEYNLVTELVIPDDATSIGAYAFYNSTSITSIIVGDNCALETIGDYAFYNCESLGTVAISDTVTSIGNSAFYGCTSLYEVYITDLDAWCKITFGDDYSGYLMYYANWLYHDNHILSGVIELSDDITSIPYGTFKNSYITSIAIPDSATSIGGYAFYLCYNLTEATIGNGVKTIGSYAFYRCFSLESITIGNSVKTTSDYAFYGCTSLTEINFNATAMDNLSSDNYVFDRAGYYENGITVNIGANVTKIPAYLFNPYSGNYAPEIINVVFEDGSVCASIGESAFYHCSSLKNITIPDSVTSIGDYAFCICTSLTSLTIGKGVTSIGDCAFYGCTALTEINFNATAMNDLSEDNYVFDYAGQSGDGIIVTIGANVTKIPAYLFYPTRDYSLNITSVVFEKNSVCKSIGTYAFAYCNSLESINMSSSVTSIGSYAFCGCKSLDGVYYSGTASQWARISFGDEYANPLYYAGNLYIDDMLIDNITLEDITSVNAYAFYNCTTLTSVIMGNSVQSIGDYSFYDCAMLEYVTTGNSVETISGYAFSGCISLIRINSDIDGEFIIPDSVTSIGKAAFSGCQNVVSITLPFVGGSANETESSASTLFGYIFDSSSYTGGTYTKQYYASNNYIAYYIPTTLTSVTITGGDLLYGAFYGCSNIISVSLGDGVTAIGTDAFYNCTALENIAIPDSVTTIGDYAFYECIALKGVAIGACITTIGNYAFYNCTSLESVTIGECITTIGNHAFYNCTALESVTIGECITTIGNYAFHNCTSLTSVYCDGTVSQWANISFSNEYANPLYYAGNLYINGTLVTDILIENITAINDYAFYNCSSLTSVTIGDGATSIGSYAFYNCTLLTSATVSDSVTSIGYSAFGGCSGLISITLPFVGGSVDAASASSSTLFGYIFGASSYDGGTSTGQYYSYSGYVSYYNIPTSLTIVTITGGQIFYGAFYNCGTLKSVTIPDSVTSIGERAFYNCTSLESITIGDGVISIGQYAFYYCTSLEMVYYNGTASQWASISFDSGLANPIYYTGNLYVKDETSETGYSLVTDIILESISTINAYAFYNCSSLTSVIIGDGATSIGSYAFYDCDALESITISDSVASIGHNAFDKCSSLVSMTLPFVGGSVDAASASSSTLFGYIFGTSSYDSDTSTIQYYSSSSYKTYYNIPISLTTVTITGGQIFYGAFYNCSSLESITLGDGVTSIGERAFYNCTSLESVTIGDGVTSIGSCAFYNSTSLTRINSNTDGVFIIPDSVTSIGSSAFGCCSNLISITMPFVGGSVDATSASNSTLFGYIFGTSSYDGGTATTQYYSSGSYATYYIPTSLTTVTITGGQIYYGAFYNCSSLTSITISDGVTSIGERVFYNCTSLEYNTYSNGYYLGDSTNQYIVLVETIDTSATTFTVNGNTKIICGRAFAGCTSLENITIPDSVTSIGSSAFYNCTSLGSITIPDSVTSIGSSAFYYCKSLKSVYYKGTVSQWASISFSNESANPLYYTGNLYINGTLLTDLIDTDIITISAYAFAGWNVASITIPDSVTSIGRGTFEGCSSLTSITIPDSVETIGWYAFYKCTSLESITIPDSVTSIGTYAFGNCASLTSITIPDSVTSIDGYVFYGCTSLESIIIPDGVTSIGEFAFTDCTSLTSIIIPSSVTYIGESAFDGCTSLESITIPDSVETISWYAFYKCTSLESVYYNGTVSQWGSISFWNATANPLYYVGNLYLNGTLLTDLKDTDITSISAYSFAGWNVTSITIPDSVTSIGKGAFEGCIALTSITIPDSVETIGGYAFYGCTSLENITIPDSVTSIGGYAFYKCTSLKSITIPNSVTSIETYAFYYCTSLESITIPDNVISIGSYAFGYCTSLESITIPDGITSLGDDAFCYCTSLTSITIPDSITSISGYAFHSCTSLTSVIIPDSVTSIGGGAFSGCTALTNIIIPDSVTSIGAYAFWCSSLESITIPDSVTSISNSVFYCCGSLESITIPDSVTSIGSYAFSDCTSLIYIIIPASVTSIGGYAFEDCDSLESVYYGGTASEWSTITFSNSYSYPTYYGAALYYYSETEPDYTDSYNYWHYVDGEITVWVQQTEE